MIQILLSNIEHNYVFFTKKFVSAVCWEREWRDVGCPGSSLIKAQKKMVLILLSNMEHNHVYFTKKFVSAVCWERAVPAPPLIKPVRLSLLLARCPVGNPKTAKKCKSSFGTTASGGDHMAKAHQQARVRIKHLPHETTVFFRQKHLTVKKCANFFGICYYANFLVKFFAKRTD